MGVAAINVPPNIASSLVTAGQKSDVDFDYLLQTAMRESSLDPHARAKSSSAVGLFQFLDSTWLEVMKSDGARLGYPSYADAIVERDGEYTIPDPKLRAEVLKLRENTQVAADLAAAFTRNNGAYLLQKFGRMPSPGELYIAHFLGAKGAEKLFTAGLQDPDQSAAKLFPKQAAANSTIFYEGGKARSIKEVYQALVARHAPLPAIDPAFATQQLAAAPASPPVPEARWSEEVVPSRFGPGDMSFTALFSTEQPPNVPRTLLTTSEAPANPGFFAGLMVNEPQTDVVNRSLIPAR
jgi:hypothetical protein